MIGFRSVLVAGALAALSASTAAVAQQTGQVLTNDSLKTMLDNLGYEPKALSKGYLIDIKQDTWDVYIQLVLSPNGAKLGFNSNLGKIDDLESVTAKRWLDLLVSNGNIDPSTFYVDREQKKLYLHRTIDNRDVTPAFLRGQIESYVSNVKNTQDLWSFGN